ncbi:MAG TPA: MFS transporter [Planctomycetaceae bacterium]|nr:MFS transporter [Planctomycetaceae bacterium]
MTETSELASLPPVARDRAFWGMTSTQFLGAFNDNLFKQLVLLICVDVNQLTQKSVDYQSYALAIFALPFVLFSGFAGWLSDRNSKRSIIVLAKIAEIGIMLLGMLVFFWGPAEKEPLLGLLFVVLGCMSVQSAFFGPSKYGILPEMFRTSDLPAVNGIVQMTTFVAIILGGALAGIGKQYWKDELWKVSFACVLIAVIGTLTSFLVRKTRIAKPGLKFETSSLVIHPHVRNMFRSDSTLLGVLLVYTLFWFMGGVLQPSANALGKDRLGMNDGHTSVLISGIAAGIAVGCVLAAKMSHHKIDFRLVTWGAWGMFASLLLTMFLTLSAPIPEIADPEVAMADESLSSLLFSVGAREWMFRLSLVLVGVSGGMFVVPLQVYLQTRPPDSLKGRTIGAMNLITWIGIIGSAVFYGICSFLLAKLKTSLSLEYVPLGYLYGVLALIILPVALFYRPTPAEEELPDPNEKLT